MRFKIWLLSIVLFLGLSHRQVSYAQPVSNNGYTVMPGFGKTQRKETTNFYDLTLQPKQVDDFQLTIINQAPKPQTFKIMVNNATTNQNLIIDYTQAHFKKDVSMGLTIKDVVTLDQSEVTIPGNQSQIIRMRMVMPNQTFNGVLLGGIVVKPVLKKPSGAGVHNVFMHTLAIRVNQNDNVVPAQLVGGSVHLNQANRHNEVTMTIRNPQPQLMSQLQGIFIITKKGATAPILRKKSQNLSIAPNSQFNVPLTLNNQFKPGHYTYTIILKNGNGQWRFTRNFEITKHEADTFNKTAVDNAKNMNANWLLYMTLASLMVILCLFFYWLGHKKTAPKP